MVHRASRDARRSRPADRLAGDAPRAWVRSLRRDPARVFDDWDPYCQGPRGVFVVTRFVRSRLRMPPVLAAARRRLRHAVPDERDATAGAGAFNGPRYCLVDVVREARRRGETPCCRLTFGPSDYRACLVTNGIEASWARRAGLAEFRDTQAWVRRFDGAADANRFFRNAFGVNVLVSVTDGRGRRFLLFRERSGVCAVRRRTTVGSADEGLRRRFGDRLFDETSASNPAPDLGRCARRAVMEEVGLHPQDVDRTSPMLLSVGIVRSVAQPAALYYWPLELSRRELELRLAVAADRHLEFGAHHYVPLERDAILDFVRRQERRAPVESWVAAGAMYAVDALPPPTVFLSYASEDRRRVRGLQDALRRGGAHAWRDDEFLRVGADWRERVEDRITRVDCVVVAMSRAAARSANARWEVGRARSLARRRGGRPRILVAYVEPRRAVGRPRWVEPDEVFAEVSEPRDRARALRRLVDDLWVACAER